MSDPVVVDLSGSAYIVATDSFVLPTSSSMFTIPSWLNDAIQQSVVTSVTPLYRKVDDCIIGSTTTTSKVDTLDTRITTFINTADDKYASKELETAVKQLSDSVLTAEDVEEKNARYISRSYNNGILRELRTRADTSANNVLSIVNGRLTRIEERADNAYFTALSSLKSINKVRNDLELEVARLEQAIEDAKAEAIAAYKAAAAEAAAARAAAEQAAADRAAAEAAAAESSSDSGSDSGSDGTA